MTALMLSPADLTAFEGVPVVSDIRLGTLLGLGRPTDVRKAIRRHKEELIAHGEVYAKVAQTSFGERWLSKSAAGRFWKQFDLVVRAH